MEFQCWFCEQGIEQEDGGAVMITVANLLRRAEGSQNDDEPVQSVYAHSQCAKDRLKGAAMDLDPSIFVEENTTLLQ